MKPLLLSLSAGLRAAAAVAACAALLVACAPAAVAPNVGGAQPAVAAVPAVDPLDATLCATMLTLAVERATREGRTREQVVDGIEAVVGTLAANPMCQEVIRQWRARNAPPAPSAAPAGPDPVSASGPPR